MSSKGPELKGILFEALEGFKGDNLVKSFDEPVSWHYLYTHVGAAGPKHETREALLMAFGWVL